MIKKLLYSYVEILLYLLKNMYNEIRALRHSIQRTARLFLLIGWLYIKLCQIWEVILQQPLLSGTTISPLACGRAVNEFFRIDVSYMGQDIKVSALTS